MSNKHQQIGRNWTKMVKNLNLSLQAMYFWPKMGENGQNENFPRHNTTLKWLKEIVSSFCASYIKFWCAVLKKKLKNLIFWPKMAKNGRTRIFFKNPLGTFFSFIKIQLCAKLKKSKAQFSRCGLTHARMHTQTDT